MRTPTRVVGPHAASRRRGGSSRRVDLLAAFLAGLVAAGAHADARAHHKVPGLETFFTPWHGSSTAGCWPWAAPWRRRWRPLLAHRLRDRGRHRGPALPHLLLALGFGMLVSAPARASWQGLPAGAIWRDRIPELLTLTLTLVAFTFFSEYANAFSRPKVGARGRAGASSGSCWGCPP